MSDENKGGSGPSAREELEARIVAWVAGEASAFEIETLRRQIEADPKLAEFKTQAESLQRLAVAAVKPDSPRLKLSSERRSKLLAAIGVVEATREERGVAVYPGPEEKKKRLKWELWAMVAVVCLGFFSVMSAFFGLDREYYKRARVLKIPVAHEAPKEMNFELKAPLMGEADAELLSVQRNAVVLPPPSPRALVSRSYGAAGGVNAPKIELADIQNEPKTTVSSEPNAPEYFSDKPIEMSPFEVTTDRDAGYAASSTLAGTRLDTGLRDVENSVSAVNQEFLRDVGATDKSDILAYTTNSETAGVAGKHAGSRASDAFGLSAQRAPVSSTEWKDVGGKKSRMRPTPSESVLGDQLVPTNADDMKQKASGDDGAVSNAAPAQAETVLGQEKSDGALVERSAETDEMTTLSRSSGAAAEQVTRADAQRKMEDSRAELGLLREAARRKAEHATLAIAGAAGKGPGVSAAGEPIGRRVYGSIGFTPSKKSAPDKSAVALAEIDAKKEPVSTFSLHVGDASFRLAHQALLRGEELDAESIRPEEFYNAFHYDDAVPALAEKVGCHIEQAAHPFRQQRSLLRIALRVPSAGRAGGQPLRLTVLLDTSGSMERTDRQEAVRAAFGALASVLKKGDQVTLIGFSRTAKLVAEAVPGEAAGQLVALIKSLPAEGGTNFEEALRVGRELALRHFTAGAQNRMVLLTDGAANLGNADPEMLAGKIDALRQQGISFDACGVGCSGIDDAILEALTRKGGGRYYVLNDAEEAGGKFAEQLAGAFRPAAENVKVQARFNAARVSHYRLIGFEHHRLREEDFRNDAVGAATLAADEAAIALYEVEILPEGEGELGEMYVRFRDTASGETVDRSWTMPYDSHVPLFDRASPRLQLTGVSAFLAEKLRGGESASQLRLEDLAQTVASLKLRYAQDANVQALSEMFNEARKRTRR